MLDFISITSEVVKLLIISKQTLKMTIIWEK